MAEREYGRQITQIGVESTEGTAVAANKRLLSLGLNLSIGYNFNKHKPNGYRRGTRFDPGKKWSIISDDGNGKPSYSTMPYILSCLYKAVTPSTPGGATNARDWTYEQSSFATEVIKTLTIEKGSAQGMERAAGCFFDGFNISGDPDSVSMTVSGMGRAVLDSVNDNIAMSTREVQTVDLSGGDDPTGGTWTLTVLGQTITALAYNVSASSLQASINALTVTGAADVTVSLAGFVYTITFPFYLGNVTQVTVNSASLTSGGTVTVTINTTTPGVAATEIEDRPIIPEHVKWFADSASGSLGTTLLTRVLSWSFGDSALRELFWTVNADNAGAAAGKADGDEPIFEVTLSVEADAAGMAFYQQAKTGATKFLRFQALDAADSIESGFRYQLTCDFAVKVKGISEFGDDQKLYKYDITFELVHDATWGKAMSIVNRNLLAAL